MRVQRSPFRWPSKAIRTWSQQRGTIRQVETSYTDLRGVALMTQTRLTLNKSVGVLSPNESSNRDIRLQYGYVVTYR